MNYTALARKYRPQTFEDIIGQDHISTTLKNAILQNRVSHAYLFAGPRGVGKTTTARIFAKALDCEKGPSPKPCNSCSSCSGITQGASLDVLEIDGASNRGIEEIRALRENVKFSPSKGKFKIYIIDEVHMLTAEAFNALLKTLEEPPPHVKFIFATTQPHKIPSTILSRCQRFDFRKISPKKIADSLKYIAREEKLDIKDDVLGLIARHADGSMRDAQVILDQVMSFREEGAVRREDILDILGAIGDDVLFELSSAISEKDPVRAINITDALIDEGKDAAQLAIGLIGHFRNICLVKISRQLDSLIDSDEEKIKRYEAEARKFSIEDILYIIFTLSNAVELIRRSSLARIPFEMSLIKLTQAGSTISIAEIVNKIERLEKNLNHQELPSDIKPAVGQKESSQKAEPKESSAIDMILNSWKDIINYIKDKKISIASYLGEAHPVSLEGSVLKIGFISGFQFHKEVLESPDNRRLIESAVKAVTKFDLRVIFVLTEPADMPGHVSNKNILSEDKSVDDNYPGKARMTGRDKDVDPLIKSALEIFDAELSEDDIKRPRPR